MKRATLIGAFIGVIISIATVTFILTSGAGMDVSESDNAASPESAATIADASPALLSSGLRTDFSQGVIDLSLILNGGPGKDGIPALTNPAFVSVNESPTTEDTQTIVVASGEEVKIYPYNILTWHEIVNDTIAGEAIAVTFCPLCGSAIVFDRTLGGETLEFGVSGLLYESNMIMYNRSDDESLWSQSLGEAVVGERTGQTLAHVSFDLMTFADAAAQHPDALVLSEDTGFNRNYTSNPYAGYDGSEQLYFDVSVQDERFPAKELFFIVPIEGNSIAVRRDKDDGEYLVPDSDVVVRVADGQYRAWWGSAELPGYIEMWFSWATHHQDSGTVI